MSQNDRVYYLLREIGGQKIHAGYHAGVGNGRLFFDWGKALYSLDLAALRKSQSSLDKARKEKLPEGKIFGILADGTNVLALVRNGDKADLMQLTGEEWQKVDETEIASPIAGCAWDEGFLFCEINPKNNSRLYRWSKEKGLQIAALFDEPLKVYSLVIKNGMLRLMVSGASPRILEIEVSKLLDGRKAQTDFRTKSLPFSVFKGLEFPSGKSLFSLDGGTQIVDQNGNQVWNDTSPGESGKQIAASAILDNRFGVIGSWRRDKSHPAACLYVFDGDRPIYKRTIMSDNPENLRWTGYETTQSGLSGTELFIPCYGGDFMQLTRLRDGEERVGATILAEGEDYTILGKLHEGEAGSKTTSEIMEVKFYENPSRELGAIWRGQNYYPANGVEKATVYITCDVEQHVQGKPYCISGADLPNAPGIYWILDALKANRLTATFFVNIYEFENYEPDFMIQLLRDIDANDCEVGLHCHTSMKNDTILNFNKVPLGKLTRSEQFKILEYGTEFIRKAIGKAPVSFRSGAYSINNDTLDILEELGYTVDSSVFISSMASQPDFKYFTRNKPAWHGKLLELPVTSMRWNGKPSKLDINWLGSCQALMAALSMCRKTGLDQLVTMCHSFSFLNFSKNPDASIAGFTFTGNRYLTGVNEKLRDEFSFFLKTIAESKEYEVRALREAPTLVSENQLPDVIPEYYSQPENSYLCPICGYQGSFIPYRGRSNAQCPACRSLERMRLKNLYLKKCLKVQNGSKLSILHAGPHMVTSAWLKSLPNVEYISTDPYNEADYHFPLEKIPFSDYSFDLAIAFAVFQHLLDDDRAFQEIWRVLKPGGKFVLWVGKLKSRITTEMYDRTKFGDMVANDFSSPANVTDSKLTEKDGKFYYNPRCATRIYGSDLIRKLENMKFHVQRLEAKDIVDHPAGMAIDDDDLILVCVKDAHFENSAESRPSKGNATINS